MRTSKILAALLCLAATPLAANTATLVRDLNADEHGLGSYSFSQLTAVQGKVFFVTSISGSNNNDGELWVNDGTSEGMRLLVDSCPEFGCTSPVSILGGVGNFLLFTNGYENLSRLWRSDGTRAGTFALHPDLIVQTGSFVQDRRAFFRGALFFTGCLEDQGCALWKTNGTPAGTVRVEDFGRDSTPGSLAVAGDRLLFTATEGNVSTSLWASDGTPAGTSQVKDLGPVVVRELTPLGGRLFFLSRNNNNQDEALWVSDGTAGGTRSLKQLPGFFSLNGLKAVGGRVYFQARDAVLGTEIWTSDGTPAGTLRVTGFGPDNPFFSAIGAAGSRAVFAADDGLHGHQIWSTAGTLASTQAVTPPCPDCGFASSSTVFAETGGRAVFLAETVDEGSDLWVTDGTTQGTHRLLDICTGDCDFIDSSPLQTVPQGVLFLAADPQHGREIWRTDGTTAGTVRMTEVDGPSSGILIDGSIHPVRVAAVAGTRLYFGAFDEESGPSLWAAERPATTRLLGLVAPQGPSSFPQDLVPFGNRLLFVANDNGTSLWSSQGTAESTAPLGPDSRSFLAESWEPTPIGSQAFYRYEDRGQGTLMRTDGTEAGTRALKGNVDSGLTEWQGKVWFPVGGNEIWTSDGTTAGTVKVLDLPAGEAGGLAGLGPELYFVFEDFDEFDWQIWRSDGTQAGTRKLLGDLFFDTFNTNAGFVRVGSLVFFLGRNEVWKTDGTPGGTAVLNPRTDGFESLAADLAVFQGSLYYFSAARRTGSFRTLWRSNGTEAGTVPIADFPVLYPAFVPGTGLMAGGGRLWFAADDGVHGTELWTSDGTTAGTKMVRDIFPGKRSSDPKSMTFAGGRLFFAADDGIHGVELWESDSTEAGTKLVQDLASLGLSSSPGNFTAVGDRLYFAAHDGPTGRELWTLPLSGPGTCQPSSTALCLGNGRFRAEVRWRDFQGNTGDGQAVSLTPDTGYFWFFDAANVELVLKVLDGRSLNGHHWVFYGALSNVEYVITVTDTETGLTRQYVNPAGQLASTGDTRGFGPLGAYSRTGPPAATSSPLISERTAAATGTCQPSATRLCLRDGRFAVEAAWKDFQGKTGQGTAVNLSGDTGYFWFFDAANVEVVLKVLDGTPVNGKHWVFYGALSNVEYTLTVTDTQTGKVKTYKNPAGRFASVADTAAF